MRLAVHAREAGDVARLELNVDTKGLAGGPIEFTADNHYRKAT